MFDLKWEPQRNSGWVRRAIQTLKISLDVRYWSCYVEILPPWATVVWSFSLFLSVGWSPVKGCDTSDTRLVSKCEDLSAYFEVKSEVKMCFERHRSSTSWVVEKLTDPNPNLVFLKENLNVQFKPLLKY